MTKSELDPSPSSVEHFDSLVLIVGLSGAGKSTASKAFSDFGFYTIDNLPVDLMPEFVKLSRSNKEKFTRSCILLDVISSEKRDELLALLNAFDKASEEYNLIFLDCANDVVVRRYSETRRPHPGFDVERDKTLTETINRERTRLAPLKERAHYTINTSTLNVHDLKRKLKETIDSFLEDGTVPIRVNFVSFGFKHGLPLDCDLVVDVRFLKNPYFIDSLKEKTGLDKEVQDFVLSSETAQEFLKNYKQLLDFLIPHYIFEGKAYLNIGIGCTGGQHRSVSLAIALSKLFEGEGRYVSVSHRDMNR